MQKLFSLALTAGMLCLLGMTKDAGATVTIALEWGACSGGMGCTATGSDTIFVIPGGGQTLRLDIFMSHDLTQGLKIHTFSLNFDTALDNELNLTPGMAPVEWGGTDVNPGPPSNLYAPVTTGLAAGTTESSGGSAGRVNSFESGVFVAVGVLPRNAAAYSVGTFTATAPARYRVGQVFFVANGATNDGEDIFSGLFNGVFDGFFDGDFNLVPMGTILFGNAYVNLGDLVPEPGTVSLLGLGLVGLVLARRRRRF